jgi:hypothetical protein
LPEDSEVLAVKFTKMDCCLIGSLLIVLTIFVSVVSANNNEDQSGSEAKTAESKQLKENAVNDRSDKVSKDSPKPAQPGEQNSGPKGLPIGSSEIRQPDWRMDSRMRNVNRINRSLESSMKNISNSIRKMNTDINKIRTLNRRF